MSESRLVSDEMWGIIDRLSRDNLPIFAAIAYYSQDLLRLSKGDLLICDASEETISSGASCGALLLELHLRGVKIYSEPTLHAKVACVGHNVIVGSANASNNSKTKLIEAAILSANSALRAQCMALVHELATEQKLLCEEDLKRLAKIEVKKRPFNKPPKPHVSVSSKSVIWWLGTGPLSQRAEKLQEELLNQGLVNAIQIPTDLPQEEIQTISWPMNARVAKVAKCGDRVVQAFATPRGNEDNCKVNAPAVIIHIERNEKVAIFFLCSLQAKRRARALGMVKKEMESRGLTMLQAKSAREITNVQFELIDSLF